jgi:two-component system sensor histidine kinase/response regulator
VTADRRAAHHAATIAYAFAEDRRTCADAGMNDFVGEPVEPDKLFATLLKWLGRY